MQDLDIQHQLYQESRPRDWKKLERLMKPQRAGEVHGKPYYRFFQTLNGTLEIVPRLINLSIQPVNSTVPFHIHNYTEITVPLRGSCQAVLPTRTIKLEQGDLLIVGNHTPHTVKKVPDGTLVVSIEIRQAAFSFNDLDLIRNQRGLTSIIFSLLADESYGEGRYGYYQSSNDRVIPLIIDDIVKEYYTGGQLSDQLVRLDLLEVFTRLTMMVDQRPNEVDQNQEKQAGTNLMAVLLYIEKNYATVTLRELAQEFSFNPNYLSELLKKQTGMTFIKLVKLQRVNVAAKYLIYTTASIDEIAQKVGYENPSYFYKVFRQILGKSPSQYRKENQV